MSQVIIYNNQNGNGISICTPSDPNNIEYVLENNCPEGAIIVDDSILPTGADTQFQTAWYISGNSVLVNFQIAQSYQLSVLNQLVYNESAHRAVKTLSGLTNVPTDSEWNALVSNAKTNISSSTTTDQLVAAIAPVQAAIKANADI